jgi:hypothetical protein
MRERKLRAATLTERLARVGDQVRLYVLGFSLSACAVLSVSCSSTAITLAQATLREQPKVHGSPWPAVSAKHACG